MPSPAQHDPHLRPLATWLILQLLTLLLPTLQIPLSENFIRPAERAGIAEMAILQIAAAAFLLPILFPSISTTLILIATSWPFLQLSGILSAIPEARIIHIALLVSAWVLTLGLWRAVLGSRRELMLASVVAGLVSVGGAILAYFQAEFVGNARVSECALGPIIWALAAIEGRPNVCSWVILAVLSTIPGALLIRRWRQIPQA